MADQRRELAVCPACRSRCMVRGRVILSEPHPASFAPDDTTDPFWRLTLDHPVVGLQLDGRSTACASCGFVAVNLAPKRLRETIQRFGKPELQTWLESMLRPEVTPAPTPPDGFVHAGIIATEEPPPRTTTLSANT